MALLTAFPSEADEDGESDGYEHAKDATSPSGTPSEKGGQSS
jgi:hypothetical protein